jgi:hypothetical protein
MWTWTVKDLPFMEIPQVLERVCPLVLQTTSQFAIV